MPRTLILALLLAAAVAPADAQERRPLRPRQQPSVSGPVAPDGKTPVLVDVPVELRLVNIGGSDGAGLCVSTSIEVAGRFQGCGPIFGLQQRRKAFPGGDSPPSTDEMLAKLAPGARYLQVVGADAAFIQLCLRSGYVVCTSVMGGQHMVNLVHLDAQYACILDNNDPYGTAKDGTRTDTTLIWKPATSYLRDSNNWGSGTWIVVVLDKGPPPPIPTNAMPAGARWQPPVYEWRHNSAFPGDLYLYRDGGLLGGWTRRYDAKGAYYPRQGPGKWLPAARPPVPVPAAPSVYDLGESLVTTATNYGCLAGTFKRGFSLNGQGIDRQTAEQLVTKGATTPFLTTVGDEAFCKAVLADMAGPLKWWSDRLIVRAFTPDHPLARNVGLQPGINLQMPAAADGTGKVLFRCKSYAGPEKLAEALRKAYPGYDPSKDPDPTAPPPSPPAPVPSPSPVAISAADWTAYAPFGVLSLILAIVLAIPGRAAALPPNSEIHPWTL